MFLIIILQKCVLYVIKYTKNHLTQTNPSIQNRKNLRMTFKNSLMTFLELKLYNVNNDITDTNCSVQHQVDFQMELQNGLTKNNAW